MCKTVSHSFHTLKRKTSCNHIDSQISLPISTRGYIQYAFLLTAMKIVFSFAIYHYAPTPSPTLSLYFNSYMLTALDGISVKNCDISKTKRS